ncbi:MAG TPA: MFS transporter [Acidimicrobiales bacterium]|nr:MFS transporter [Acidimicrobiales bacterium]
MSETDFTGRPARRGWILGVLATTQLMVALDATVISIALPQAQRALGFSSANRAWPVTAYVLAFGSLLLLGGRLVDLWGRRSTLVVGLAGFAVASWVGGAASSFSTLVWARVGQGLFGALLAPATLATLSTTFSEPRERARAFSLYGILWGSGAALGLLLGGALTQWASWRYCLYVNVGFSAIALVGTGLVIEPGRDEGRTHLDALGILLASASFFFVVFGFSHAVTTAWDDPVTATSLVAGGVLLVAFALWQRRAPYPVVAPRLIATRMRAGSLLALFLTSVAVFGVSLFLVYYLEGTIGYSPLRIGVAFIPLVAATAFSSSLASARLLAQVGPRPLVPVGMVLATLGMVLFTRLTPTSDYFSSVMPGLLLTGLGLGLILAPAIATATAGLERRDVGAASALVVAAQQIGASMGLALLNTIAVSVATRAVTHGASAAFANLHGYAVAFWWAAGFFGVGALASFVVLESGAVEGIATEDELGQPVEPI